MIYILLYGGFHKWGRPHSWLVFVRENPIEDDHWGYPHDSGNLHLWYPTSIWLVVGPHLWKIWLRQLGWLEIPNIFGKIIQKWQPFTTNQLWIYRSSGHQVVPLRQLQQGPLALCRGQRVLAKTWMLTIEKWWFKIKELFFLMENVDFWKQVFTISIVRVML